MSRFGNLYSKYNKNGFTGIDILVQKFWTNTKWQSKKQRIDWTSTTLQLSTLLSHRRLVLPHRANLPLSLSPRHWTLTPRTSRYLRDHPYLWISKALSARFRLWRSQHHLIYIPILEGSLPSILSRRHLIICFNPIKFHLRHNHFLIYAVQIKFTPLHILPST